MHSRRPILILGVVVSLAQTIPTNGLELGPKDGDQAQAVTDAFVDFGSPQPQPPAPKSHELVPNEVTITKGGTVTFRVNGAGHGIAIYPVSRNTTRDDVTNQLCIHDAVTDLCVDMTFANDEHQIVDGRGNVVIDTGTNPPLDRVDDPTARLMASSTIVANPDGTTVSGAFLTGTNATGAAGNQIEYRFTKTGRFLVICMTRTHYLNDWMFGFVNVVRSDGAEQ